MNDLLSRKEVVEYLRKENYEDDIVGIIDNFPPAEIPDTPVWRDEIVEAEKALATCLECLSHNTMAYAMAADALKYLRALKPQDGGK
jgi:hypothetical protein